MQLHEKRESPKTKKVIILKKADESIHLGPSLPAESYRNLKRLVEASVETNADLVHPGYGFLAENADFGISHAFIESPTAYISL